ncbi:MAG: hypothetical protein C0483_11165 [Pirellula sp.]|nr:hypothetical protein [Pirellula sp.]
MMRDLTRLGSEPLSRRGALASLAAAGLSSFVAGCGVSEYETRMDETIKNLALENRFVNLLPEATPLNSQTSTVGVVATIRLPKMIGRNGNAQPLLIEEGAAKPEKADEQMPIERLMPPGPLPTIPGFQVCVEAPAPSTVGLRTCYFYAGIERADAATAKATRDALLTKLKADLTAKVMAEIANSSAWVDVQVTSPAPGAPKRTFKQLDVTCQQLFEVRGNAASTTAGTFRLLAYETLGHQIFLGWRVPQLALEYQKFMDSTDSAAGTLTVVAGKPVVAPAATATAS